MALCKDCCNIFECWHELLENLDNNGFLHCNNVFDLEASAVAGCPLCTQWLQHMKKNDKEYQKLKEMTTSLLGVGSKLEGSYVRAWTLKSFTQLDRDDCWRLNLVFRLPLVANTLNNPDDSEKPQNRKAGMLEHTTCVADQSSEAAGEGSDGESGEGESGNDCDSRFGSDWGDDENRFKMFHFGVDVVPSQQPEALEENVLCSKVPKRSQDALWQARKWLESCCKEHTTCTTAHETFSSPTRLIFIGDDKVNLHLTSDIPPRPRYATLSHCWGSIKFEVLTRETLERYRKGIPLESLTQTFRDAVIIARELGFQYIWIDSLCIIQGDSIDWRKESASMSAVYGAAVINIAATSARNGSGGCLVDRDPDTLFRHQVQVNMGDGTRLHDCVVQNFYSYDNPLGQRGWVMQERFLSSRILHFNNQQLFWECNEKVACEVYPDRFHNALGYYDFALQKTPVNLDLWTDILTHYWNCDLTNPRDKLVAISGLAKFIKHQTNDEYFAGLWRKDFEIQLCWRGIGMAEKTDIYLGPSWSWAGNSCRAGIALNPKNMTDYALYARASEVDTSLVVPDSLGEVVGGCLKLACQFLIPMVFAAVENFYLRRREILVGDIHAAVLVYWDFSDRPNELVYLLPVVDERSKSPSINGLVLLPTTQRGQYVRVGQFTTERDTDYKTLREAFDTYQCRLTISNYLEAYKENGKPLKVVEII